jgi:hypothetical protein
MSERSGLDRRRRRVSALKIPSSAAARRDLDDEADQPEGDFHHSLSLGIELTCGER